MSITLGGRDETFYWGKEFNFFLLRCVADSIEVEREKETLMEGLIYFWDFSLKFHPPVPHHTRHLAWEHWEYLWSLRSLTLSWQEGARLASCWHLSCGDQCGDHDHWSCCHPWHSPPFCCQAATQIIINWISLQLTTSRWEDHIHLL